MGEGELADTVLAALGGDVGRLKAYSGGYDAEIAAALEGALGGPSGVHAANALAGIHAVEALPRLREVLRRIGGKHPTGRASSAAIRRLEARAGLPRASATEAAEVDTLPRAAREPGPTLRLRPGFASAAGLRSRSRPAVAIPGMPQPEPRITLTGSPWPESSLAFDRGDAPAPVAPPTRTTL